MNQTGTVIRTEGERALVTLAHRRDEHREHASCCTGSLEAAETESHQVEARNVPHATTGDRVEVRLPEQRGVGGWLVALLPAVLLPVAGAIAGGLIGGDAATGIGVGVGLVIGIALTAMLSRRMSADPRYRAVVLRILDTGSRAGPCPVCDARATRKE